MKVIPAIDIRGGKCVRLYMGDFSRETVYSANPVDIAMRFEAEGAPMLHVVDLDGAKEGSPVNLPVVRRICEAVSIPVETGGGMRSLESIQSAFAAGVSRVVLGTAALQDPALLEEALQKWGERIAVSLDAREGLVATGGWLETSAVRAADLASSLAKRGVRSLIYTDISRDGTLTGPNLEGLRAIGNAAGPDVELIASGGVSSLADLVALRDAGADATIVGKAIYSGAFDLRAALAEMGEGESSVSPAKREVS